MWVPISYSYKFSQYHLGWIINIQNNYHILGSTFDPIFTKLKISNDCVSLILNINPAEYDINLSSRPYKCYTQKEFNCFEGLMHLNTLIRGGAFYYMNNPSNLFAHLLELNNNCQNLFVNNILGEVERGALKYRNFNSRSRVGKTVYDITKTILSDHFYQNNFFFNSNNIWKLREEWLKQKDFLKLHEYFDINSLYVESNQIHNDLYWYFDKKIKINK